MLYRTRKKPISGLAEPGLCLLPASEHTEQFGINAHLLPRVVGFHIADLLPNNPAAVFDARILRTTCCLVISSVKSTVFTPRSTAFITN